MSDMTTAGIIERLEKATGPDEELDRAIFDTVTGGVFGPENAKFWHSTSALSRAANEFTRSIDAALTLVPEGWIVQLDEWEADTLRERGAWQTILVRRGKRDDFRCAFDARCYHAPTPAIALCITALKARSRSNKGEG